jgi:hypothetical protein
MSKAVKQTTTNAEIKLLSFIGCKRKIDLSIILLNKNINPTKIKTNTSNIQNIGRWPVEAITSFGDDKY